MSKPNQQHPRRRPPRGDRQQRRKVLMQRARGEELRGWLHSKQQLAGDSPKDTADARAFIGRLTQRLFGRTLSASLSATQRSVAQQISAQTGASHQERRRRSRLLVDPRPSERLLDQPQARSVRRRGAERIVADGSNVPYRNPGRPAKLARAGRLRTDMREDLP